MLEYRRPVIPDPYPPLEFESITGFRYRSRLELGREKEALRISTSREASYMTLADYTVDFKVDGVRHEITVPAGMLTDLTSVPRLFRSLVGRVGPHLEAAIVHDFLFIAWQLLPDRTARRRDWRFANAVMFAGLKAARVSWFQRALIQAALTAPVFSWGLYRRRDDGEDGLGLFVAALK